MKRGYVYRAAPRRKKKRSEASEMEEGEEGGLWRKRENGIFLLFWEIITRKFPINPAIAFFLLSHPSQLSSFHISPYGLHHC